MLICMLLCHASAVGLRDRCIYLEQPMYLSKNGIFTQYLGIFSSFKGFPEEGSRGGILQQDESQMA